MKKLSVVLILFLLSLVSIKSQPKTSSLVEVREIGDLGFKFIDSSAVTSNAYEFLYSGNDKIFLSGNYKYSQFPDYYNCVAYVNFGTGMLWKDDFYIDDEPKRSILSNVVINDDTLLTATTPNGINYYSASGEIIKTIPQLSGYLVVYPFYENGLVITLVNAKVYAHKLNFETGVLGDSFLVATAVNWIEDVEVFNGTIYINITKPDGGVLKTTIFKLNENGIIWQTTLNKFGSTCLAISSTIIYVAGDSVTMTGVTSKLIALDNNGGELWRRSFKYTLSNDQTMTLSKSVTINTLTNDCVIGGYVADPGSTAFINSWNQNGEKLWDYVDSNGLTFNLREIFWNENNELIVCGVGFKTNNSFGVLLKKYYIQGITTGPPNETQFPISYSSEQNYPNPFNPSTTIQYTLPAPTMVLLKIYDIMGNEVATLANSYQPAGTYKVPFDGHNLPSGVYFYKLKTHEFSSTNKMVLNK